MPKPRRDTSPALPPGNVTIPCMGQMYTKTAQSLVALSHRLPPGSSTTFMDSLSTIAGKRNAAAAYFLEDPKLKWLCFIDSDMVVPPDAIIRLLRTPGDVVGGLYCQREPPYLFEAGWVDEGSLSDDPRRPTDTEGVQYRLLTVDQVDGQPHSVDVVGTGLMLIRRRVLEAVDPPWFEPNERNLKGYGQNEDWNFCLRAKRAGFNVVCNTAVYADHLHGPQPLSLEFVRTWHEMHRTPRVKVTMLGTG